jgi:hypothetical protein
VGRRKTWAKAVVVFVVIVTGVIVVLVIFLRGLGLWWL